MKILHQEMELREETRGLQQARPALAAEPVTNQSEVLAETQQDLAARVNQVNLDIRELPDAENAFRRELILLTQVRQVMLERTAVASRDYRARDDRRRNGGH